MESTFIAYPYMTNFIVAEASSQSVTFKHNVELFIGGHTDSPISNIYGSANIPVSFTQYHVQFLY